MESKLFTDNIYESLKGILEIDDNTLSDEAVEVIENMLNGAITGSVKEKLVQELLDKNLDLSDEVLAEATKTVQEECDAYLIENNVTSPYKQHIIQHVFNLLLEPIREASTRNDMNADVTIEWYKMEKDAAIPTYAHPTDACADIYAIEDQVIPAHSLSNMVRTGLIAVTPAGWFIDGRMRSGIAAKTGLRLSNSVATIDAMYRGEIKFMFDNFGDEDYTIHKGDRIAQVRPVRAYTMKSVETLTVDKTDRGAGGFGSSGK